MSHYLMLLRLRDISQNNLISKAKKYLKPGQKPPAGVQIHTGPRKGMYYNTEDLKALKESKKKEAPKKEETGEKKARLPAFRKQEDGSVMHRTKEGEHGPGAYSIHEKDGEHHLTFTGKDGDVKSLGKHTDIKELKRMVAGFKGGEQEGVKSVISSRKQKELNAIDKRLVDRMKSSDYVNIGKTPEEKSQEDADYRSGYMAGYEFIQSDKGLSPTHVRKWAESVYDKSSAQYWGVIDALRDAGTYHSKNVQKKWRDTGSVWKNLKPEDISDEDIGINKPAEDIPAKPERKTKPLVNVPEEKPVSQVRDQKATVRRRKEAETTQPSFTAKLGKRYTVNSGNQFQRVEVTDPDTNETSVYDVKIREGRSGTALFTKTEAKAEAIRLATERKEKGSDAIIQGISGKMHEQKTKPSAPLAQQAIDKHIASNKEKNIDRLVFARSGDSYLTSTGETIPANKLEQNVNRLSIEHGKYVDVLEQVNKQGDLGHTRTISTPGTEDKPFSSGERETKPSSPLTSGDKRHDPDQKKIATGLGTTEKKKAKESVAEFGVDTRQKIKEIAEKKTRQDRLSQNRLDTKNW